MILPEMINPVVSVVMPYRNAEATIMETVASVQAQSLAQFELIAVDDDSQDDSHTLLEHEAARDPRIRILRPGRIGVAEAMNRGCDAARAPYIARIDADDHMHPERLALQSRFLHDNPSISLVSSRVKLFPQEQIQSGFQHYIDWQNGCTTPDDIACECYVELPVANPSIMFRRALLQSIGGFRQGDFPEDYEFILRALHHNHRLAKLPEVLLYWRESEGRLTRTDERYRRTAFDQVRTDYLCKDARLKGRSLVFWGAGRKTRRRTDQLIERGLAPTVWIDIDPGKIGQQINAIPVEAPEWLERQIPLPFVLSWVTNHGAREAIRAFLERAGYRRGRDYLMVG